MEKPLFKSVKATQLEAPPWVWHRIQSTIATQPKVAPWVFRLIPAAMVASIFFSVATIEVQHVRANNTANQTITTIFNPSSSDLLVNWDI